MMVPTRGTEIRPDLSTTRRNSASTDPQIASALAEFQQTRPQTRLLHNPTNLGFVGSVNRGILDSREDLLLLNSDTLPTRGFLGEMLKIAALDERIATITPFSNHAEICSFPEFCKDNPLPADLAEVASAFMQEPAVPIDAPTGVGFCMWLRRAALDQLGAFDEATFGRGYGEENDFCQRAAGHGWRNVIAPNAYVAHIGNASFSATGERAGGENLRRLSARYPRYNAAVADFIARDPLAAVRARVALRLENRPQ